MCTGVVIGFAGEKFSGSPSKLGDFPTSRITDVSTISIGIKSFVAKYGWNVTLSRLGFLPMGLVDPFWCRKIRCASAMAATAIGKMKCSEKNRVSVGCDTEKFPHIHFTKSFPMYGMAENRLVITVAPQNDICPHGSTYPRKAVAMTRIISTIPVIHTNGRVDGELYINPREMCT